MASRQRATQIVPMIRGAFIRAAKSLETRKNLSLTDLIAKELEERPLDTIRAIAHFVPKELLVERSIVEEMDEMSDEALDAEIRRLYAEAGAVPGTASEDTKTTH
jgi:hypothetical protein